METLITPTIHSYPSRRSSFHSSEPRIANEFIHHSTPIDPENQRKKTKNDYLTAQGHVCVQNVKENCEKPRRKRKTVDQLNTDYLTAQGHVQVGTMTSKTHRRKSEEILTTDYQHVDVVPVTKQSPPHTANRRKENQRKKEDYLTAQGHVHVDHPRDTTTPVERSPSSYDNVEVIPVNRPSIRTISRRTRSCETKKNSREHVRIELINKADLSSESTVTDDYDGENQFVDNNVSIIYIDEDDLHISSQKQKTLEIIPPPDHVDIHLVPRDSSSTKTRQFIKKQEEKQEYLTARGHVHVDRSKKPKYDYILVGESRRSHRLPRDQIYFSSDESPSSDLQIIEVSQSENQWIVLHDLEVSADNQRAIDQATDNRPQTPLFQKRPFFGASKRTAAYQVENKDPPSSPYNRFAKTVQPETNPQQAEPNTLVFDDIAKISSATNAHQRPAPINTQNIMSIKKPMKWYRRPCCWLFIAIIIILLLAGITALILAMFLIGRTTTTTTGTTTTTTSATTTTTTSATTTTTTSVTTTTSTSSTSTSSTSSTSTSSTSSTSTSSTSTSSTSSTSTSSTSTTSTSTTSSSSTSTSSTSSTSTTSETTTTTTSTSSTSTSSTSTTSTTSTSSSTSTTTSTTTSSTSTTSTSTSTTSTTSSTSSTSTTSTTSSSTSTSTTSTSTSSTTSSTSSTSSTSTTSETTTTTSSSSTSSSSTTSTTSETTTTTETTSSTSSTSSTTDTTTTSSSTSSTSSTSSSSTSSTSTSTTSETTTSSSSTSSTSETTSTTSSTTTVTQTTTVCSIGSGRGNTLNVTGSDPSSWTQYRFNYTATSIQHFIIFAFQSENNREYYLDDVSVTNVNTPGVQLLNNPSFENSTSITDWSVWCSSTCSGNVAIIETGSNCYLGTGKCLKNKCYASTGIEFVGQSFSATVGNIYSITFRLNLGGSGVSTNQRFFFDII